MFWIALVARVLLALPFLVFSLNYFLHFIPNPPPPPEGSAAAVFTGALYTSGYLTAVKVLELTGGLLVLSGRLVPLGLVILSPIALNILFFEVFMVGQAGPGVPLVVLCAALIWVYRSHFRALFAVTPQIG
ncbi:hypothetical protein [Gemmata sp.]|uniref:hypothetical protein n=1 Tax=Gemmata sp. TaxID=1914242 RepID=UPI003F71971C